MPTIQHKMLGIDAGDFRPGSQSRNDLLHNIDQIFLQLPSPVSMIFAPRTHFTNSTVNFASDGVLWNSRFARSRETADGGIVYDHETAVGIFNADCPIICMQEGKKLAVLHGGYRCLMRKDPQEEGIIETTLHQFDRKQVKVYIFGGIGPCCWKPEYKDYPELLKPSLCKHPDILTCCRGVTEKRSPVGANYLSVNLYQLANELLLRMGVPSTHITMDPRCTCCAVENGQPIYWSHGRFEAKKQPLDGRNLSLAWLGE